LLDLFAFLEDLLLEQRPALFLAIDAILELANLHFFPLSGRTLEHHAIVAGD
jgi:hypothetical protein